MEPEEEEAVIETPPKAKKAVKWVTKEKVKDKKPLVFKENKWNPDIELVKLN